MCFMALLFFKYDITARIAFVLDVDGLPSNVFGILVCLICLNQFQFTGKVNCYQIQLKIDLSFLNIPNNFSMCCGFEVLDMFLITRV